MPTERHTDELRITAKQFEKMKRVALGKQVKTDKQASERFSEVLQIMRKVGANVFEALLTSWIEQAFPHLLPLWRSFVEFLHNPSGGFRWPEKW